jgi:iron complex outermembrane receptor protein
MRITVLIASFIVFPLLLWSQDCTLSISGYIKDKGTDIPLEFANVYIEETKKGAVSDETGFFKIDHLCPGEYHLILSHIGCDPDQQFVEFTKDTILNIYLQHHSELLDEVVVHASKEDNSTQQSSSISRENITSESNKNLSDILEQVAGVSVLRSGSGVSKPVIHGLYGNRVAILNNGLVQAGQQWGNDHAPEIDPFVADHLSVVKGAGALAYSGNSLGSIVLVETDNISKDPHPHGEANYVFQSNGLGHTLNASIEKNERWAAWRLTGTLKQHGDNKTPSYFLTNTGKKEGNIALQLEKQLNDKWFTEIYYSLFNTEIGILRGSHIGNLTDLENALEKEEPFFTKDHFSYQIEAPRQEVNHHLLKLGVKYIIDDAKVFKIKYGGQLNKRKEFDVRRNDRSDIPALSLDQYTNYLEGEFNASLPGNYFIKTGLQLNITDNTNNPETGILPLIPDYRSFQSSAFFIAQKDKERVFYELGARYDLKNLDVITITQTLPHEIERFNHVFHNYSLSGGTKITLTPHFKTNLNMGYTLRTPEVNELYSFGLHQGVSGIEEGTKTLNAEKSFKIIWSNDLEIREKLFFQALGYFQNIEDYIYLQPQSEYRLTIRGAFPVFIYQQTNANIYGADLLLKYEPMETLDLLVRYALVRGKDLTNNLYLINMPSDNIFTSVKYSINDGLLFKNTNFSINAKYVFKQNKIIPEQDFTPVPEAYFLLGLTMGTHFKLKDNLLKITLKADNLLNEKYRDYLNRFRYFANEPGLNISLNLNYTF